MVTLVSFLLTIFTEFRQLKTNLQALCCLTARIKGRTTIKVAPEVLSRGLLQAPVEPRTPAGATGGSNRDKRAAPTVERVHSQSGTASVWGTTPHKCLKGAHCTEVGPKLPKQQSTHHHATVPAMYRVHMQRLLPVPTQKNAPGKVRNEERINSHVIWSIVISR